jgi:hypothetical protein
MTACRFGARALERGSDPSFEAALPKRMLEWRPSSSRKPPIVEPEARRLDAILTAGLLILAAMFAYGAQVMAAEGVAVQSIEVEGTAFRITLSDGRVLAQDQLPGTILALGDGTGRHRRVRIDGVERDRQDPASEIVLYTFSEQDSESGEWRKVSSGAS